MHLKEMWFIGTLCGSLWEIANIGSIVSVQFLGEGVGYSVVQAALSVSGKYIYTCTNIFTLYIRVFSWSIH
jgi:hypothetical protein